MKKEKDVIEKPTIKIDKNVMKYGDEAIQLRNISRIEVSPIPKEEYANWAILGAILGVVLLESDMKLLSFLILCICVGRLILTYFNNTQLGDYLILELNSGKAVIFSCGENNKSFLRKAQDEIIKSLNGQGEKIEMNFQNCKIGSVMDKRQIVKNTVNARDTGNVVVGGIGETTQIITDNNNIKFSSITGKEIDYLSRRIGDEIGRMRTGEENRLLSELKVLIDNRNEAGLSQKIKDNWNTIITGGISSALGTYAVDIMKKLLGF